MILVLGAAKGELGYSCLYSSFGYGGAFFIVTALVPPLLVTHALVLSLLVRRQTASEPDRSQRPERV
jgi:hypothetical protein